MDLSKLTDLKRMLHEATEFSKVWDHFLTHFGEREEFMSVGEPVKEDEFIQQLVTEVCRSLFPGLPKILIRSQLIRIPEQQFVHGSLFLDDKMSGILYFEDIHKGLLAVVWTIAPPETKFVRFTGRAMYDGLGRSAN